MIPATDLARLFLGAGLLAFASYTDWKWRRAPNLLWIVMLAAGLLLLAVDAVLRFPDVRAAWPYLLFAPALVVAYYFLYQFGLIAGGADAKALMALAVLAPFPIAYSTALPVFQSPFPGGVVVFVNALLAFLVIPLAYFLVNLARLDLDPMAFLGVRRRVQDVDKGHYWLMERVDDEGKVRRHYFASRAAYDLEEEKRKLLEKGVERVWVTPKVPFMIPLTIGFVLAFTVGDLLFGALAFLLG